jgi:AcrR family transcriptional regulator
VPDDLRTRLVDAGAELLAREGLQALSLREIARRAGVSHGAPRRYFPTHQALLAAIAWRGYRELGSQATEAAKAEPEPRARVLAMSRVYLRFARAHRGMFELMFRHDLMDGGGTRLREACLPLFDALVALVAQAKPGSDPVTVAGAYWANLHGIAQLSQWGALQLALGTEDTEPLLAAVLDAHLTPGDRRAVAADHPFGAHPLEPLRLAAHGRGA